MLDPTPAASCRSRPAKRRCSLASAKLAASTSASVQSWPAGPRASSPVAFCTHGAIARPPPSVGVLDNESRRAPRDQAPSAVSASRPRPIVGNRKTGRLGTPRSRPGHRWRGALAAGRPGARHRQAVRRGAGGAERRPRSTPSTLPPSVRTPAAPRPRRRGAGVFQADFAALVTGALPPEAAGKPLEIWWRDEARVGQQGTTTRVWAERGSRPAAPKDCRYAWAYLFGAVCPARGVGAGLVLPAANAAMMNLHLVEIGGQVAEGAHAVVIMDGAGRHQTGGELGVPANITTLRPPPYAPELNLVENV